MKKDEVKIIQESLEKNIKELYYGKDGKPNESSTLATAMVLQSVDIILKTLSTVDSKYLLKLAPLKIAQINITENLLGDRMNDEDLKYVRSKREILIMLNKIRNL